MMSVRTDEVVGGAESGNVDARKMESLSSSGGECVRSAGESVLRAPPPPPAEDDDDEAPAEPLTESQPSSEGWAALTMLALGGMC